MTVLRRSPQVVLLHHLLHQFPPSHHLLQPVVLLHLVVMKLQLMLLQIVIVELQLVHVIILLIHNQNLPVTIHLMTLLLFFLPLMY